MFCLGSKCFFRCQEKWFLVLIRLQLQKKYRQDENISSVNEGCHQVFLVLRNKPVLTLIQELPSPAI